MTGKGRYWNHESCSWMTHEATTLATPEALDEALPEQRTDEATVAGATTTADSVSPA